MAKAKKPATSNKKRAAKKKAPTAVRLQEFRKVARPEAYNLFLKKHGLDGVPIDAEAAKKFPAAFRNYWEDVISHG